MRPFVPVLLLGLLVLPGCADTPDPSAASTSTVVATRSPDGFFVAVGGKRFPLELLEPRRVVRLARTVFPEVSVAESRDVARIELDSPASARALVEAARFADALVVARRGLEAGTGPSPATDAGVVAETIRRWLLPEPDGALPDWAALSRALDDESVWHVSPVTAGLGSVVFAGMILADDASEAGRDKAKVLLSRTVAMRDVPEWLSWIAYVAWSRRDFLASDESP